MIFLTLGTQLPFDRLTRAMDAWAAAHPETEVFGQIAELSAESYRPVHFKWVEKMPPDRYAEQCARAGLLVGHAGMGAIITALTLGKPLVIMPRRADLREHRNEHQRATAARFGDKPGITVAEDDAALHAALNRLTAEGAAGGGAPIPDRAPSRFTDALRGFILTGASPARSAPPQDLDNQAATPRPAISVIIPHLNQPDLLRLCLERLAAQEGGARLLEALVIDNGSRADLSAEAVCNAFPFVRLLHQPIPGPGPARNLGVAQAKGDLLAFTDSDCLPSPGWLQAVEMAFADPEAQVIGGQITIWRQFPARPTPTEAYESVYSFRTRDYVERQKYAATANMAARRDAFDRVGPFGGIDIAEDTDWGKRATALGLRIRYVPEAWIEHPARPDFTDLMRKWERLTSHRWTEARRSLRGRIRWTLTAGALVVSPLAEIPQILRSDRVSGAGERWLAFQMLARVRLGRAGLMLRLLVGKGPSAGDVWNRD
jgi:GT2 family glycosyltransferase/UDP-N-acetylglucosamine transferase subunit ALG13